MPLENWYLHFEIPTFFLSHLCTSWNGHNIARSANLTHKTRWKCFFVKKIMMIQRCIYVQTTKPATLPLIKTRNFQKQLCRIINWMWWERARTMHGRTMLRKQQKFTYLPRKHLFTNKPLQTSCFSKMFLSY